MRRSRKLFAIGGFLTLFAVACGGPGTEEAPTPVQEPAQVQTQEESPTQAQEPTQAQTPLDSVETISLTWMREQIGEGIKPAFALEKGGVVHVAFLSEDEHGHVYYANNASGSFEIVQVSEGYFYGPVDIAIDSNGTPFIAYHDHQETTFMPRAGDEVVAHLEGENWELVTVRHEGHDGWDNSIVVDSEGAWHTASVDPSQFGSQDGIEYATNAGGTISVTAVGSGPIKYEFGTSIQLKPDGNPAITYYNDVDQQLEYASLGEEGWSVEIVDDDGDAGRYSSLAFDAEGRPHISYYVATASNTGIVRYAWWDGDTWQMENVDTLENVQMGHIGARKITALEIDSNGVLHLAYTDRDRLVYARRGETGWSMQEVAQAGEMPFGQLVEVDIDEQGNPHLIWFEVSSTSPVLEGVVVYAKGS